ncbi:hypothetical protein, partial [Mycoplasmopsis arginini]|uniref:hypothetical protein n=1 Tax=Mycoplasmopsis arginini TaxID=2094 RepID=UPI00249E98D3
MSWEKDDGRSDYEYYGNSGHNDYYSRNEERQLDYDRGFYQARQEHEGRCYRNQQEQDYWDSQYQDDDEIEYYLQMENEYYENHF